MMVGVFYAQDGNISDDIRLIAATDGGVITTNTVTLDTSSSPFPGNPPTFTLYGDTERGPPVTSTWTRDGVEITDSTSFSISLRVNTILEDSPFGPNNNDAAFSNSRYRSTLTVTGSLPGNYQYSVNNRAMTNPRVDSFVIEGTNKECCHRIFLLCLA